MLPCEKLMPKNRNGANRGTGIAFGKKFNKVKVIEDYS